jgi:hypothetical protein
MTLHVPFDRFAETVNRVLEVKEAYVRSLGGSVVITACGRTGATLVRSIANVPLEEAMAALREAGIEAFEGSWAPDEVSLEPDGVCTAHVAAVAYQSGEDKPGLWVDAFPTAPTPVQVFRALYDEFRETGELDEISFEEFVRQANPNVVVVSPAEIQGFLTQKDPC